MEMLCLIPVLAHFKLCFLPRLDTATEERRKGKIAAAQSTRLNSITKVLAHYELEDVAAFNILGVPLTSDLLVMAAGTRHPHARPYARTHSHALANPHTSATEHVRCL